MHNLLIKFILNRYAEWVVLAIFLLQLETQQFDDCYSIPLFLWKHNLIIIQYESLFVR